MIKEQNYTKVAEYTKKAFQVFTKRALAAQLIDILTHPTQKKEITLNNEVDSKTDNDSLSQLIPERKNQEEIGGKTGIMRFDQQTRNDIKEDIATLKIQQIFFGDVVGFQVRENEVCRMAVMFNGVKFYTQKQLPISSLTKKKMCFQICSPSFQLGERREAVTSESMVCFKSILNGKYLKTTSNIIATYQLGYELAFDSQPSKECLFRMVSNNDKSQQIWTDHDICISSYYTPDIFWSLDSLSMQKKERSLNHDKKQLFFKQDKKEDGPVERILMASYIPTWFRVTISSFRDFMSYPYSYIVCNSIGSKVRAEYVPFSNSTLRKQYRQLDNEESSEKISTLNFNESCYFYELSNLRMSKEVQIRQEESLSLYQVWEIEKIRIVDETLIECSITNVVTNQSLVDFSQTRGNTLFLKKIEGSQNQYYILNNENVNLSAVYEGQGENYVLKFQPNLTSKSTSVNKSCVFEFSLIELELSKCEALVELIQCCEMLENGYPIIQKWGFKYQEIEFKLIYSMTELKNNLLLLRRKVKELMLVIEKLKKIIEGPQSDASGLRDMVRQLKIFELLILYCKTINSKIDSPKTRERVNKSSIYLLAETQLKDFQISLFQILYILVYNNQENSEIIIDHNIFFNHLLQIYPETIGVLLEESIKNLCLLTTKISKQELVLFEWTKLIDFITTEDQINIQRKYVDIISEVAIDPNDIGITPYQNKIKEQLFSRTKKKIFPKYILQEQIGPLINFQYSDFPIEIEVMGIGKCFELKTLFRQRQCRTEFTSHVDYINSLLKLFRNLCKDRNRKMPKIVEDYGLTQKYMHAVFLNGEIGWELVARFLDLYCSMYLIQDPFVSFDKKEVKCFAWEKIESIDFSKKTSIIFKQFTEEHQAQEKLKQFDFHILPLLEKYFQEITFSFEQKQQNIYSMMFEEGLRGINSFTVFVSVVYEIVNYGYLSLNVVNRYLTLILKQTSFILFSEENIEKKRKLLFKVIELSRMAEQINTILHCMNLLKKIYNSFKGDMPPSRQQISDIILKALSINPKILQQYSPPLRKMSLKSNKYASQKSFYSSYLEGKGEQLDLLKFTLSGIVESLYRHNTFGVKKMLGLLELISQRGERICGFLTDILIFNQVEEENLYLQYSGITPQSFMGDTTNSSRRLLNVMKVKELVDKITEENVDCGDEERKKQKIYQLNNLLSKILTNLQRLKNKNYKLFSVCQTLLQKLKMHSILAQVLRFHEHESYHELIGDIIKFFCEFVEGNSENMVVMTGFFSLLTKKYSYRRLPDLLKMLFSSMSDPFAAFDMIFSNIGKKMKQNQRQIFFSCLYKIVKIFPPLLFDQIKGNIIYTLISLNDFRNYIKGDSISKNFIHLLCFIGQGIAGVHHKIKQIVKRSHLLEILQTSQSSYELKWVYLKLYHFLYIQSETKFDKIEAYLIMENIFLNQLKNLPGTCRMSALAAMRESEMEDQIEKNIPGIKQKIEEEYKSLVRETGDTLHPTNQQSYFNYLISIDDQEQFSMLSCLQIYISKFNVPCIDHLSSFVFRVISFMDKIYIKEQTYHSKILSKLYNLCEILDQKYNCVYSLTKKIPHSEAYQIVQKFFRRIAAIIQKESISYAKILQCADVTYAEIAIARSQHDSCKLVPLSSFKKFVLNLSRLVNNRQQFIQLSDTTIKQFFYQFKQKNNQKLNMLSFVTKLLEVLQYEKNQMAVRLNNQKLPSEVSLEWSEDRSNSFVNRQLIRNEFQCYKETYEMLLKETMKNKIQSQISSLVDAKISSQCANGCFSLLEMSYIGKQYSTSKLIMSEFFMKWTVEEALSGITVKDIEKYLTFCLKCFSKDFDINLLNSLFHLYEKLKTKPQMMSLFCKFMLSLNGVISMTITSSQNNDVFDFLERFYSLIQMLSENECFCQMHAELEESAVSLFIFCFLKVHETENVNIYWVNCCEVLLNSMIVSFDRVQRIAEKMSKNEQFIEVLAKFLNSEFWSNLSRMNSKYFRIGNQIFLLLIKLNTQGFQKEVGKIVSSWYFDALFQQVEKHYLPILDNKDIKKQYCRKEAGCSLEFCNQGKMTPFDHQKVRTMMNLLTVIFISADLTMLGLADPIPSVTLTNYMSWKKGSTDTLSQNTFKLFSIIHKVQLKHQSSTCQVYFDLPFLDKVSKPSFEQRLNGEVKIFKKDKFFNNIYKLSFFVQKELEKQEEKSYQFLVDHFEKISVYIQFICLTYLIIVCSLNLYKGFHNEEMKNILDVFNGIILTIKVCLFGWEFVRFIGERALLSEIQYLEYSIFWKYSRICTNVLILICYCLQLSLSQFYPVTLILQLYRIKGFEQFAHYLIEGFRIICYLLVLIEVIVLLSAFLIVQNGYSETVLSVFLQIQSEAVLLSNVSIFGEDQTSFPLFRAVPFMIPTFIIVIIISKIFFISSIINAIFKRKALTNNEGQVCSVCGGEKSFFEKNKINFSTHITREHSIWNYIYFFIFLRRGKSEHLIFRKIKEQIEKEDFQFFKLNHEK